MQITSNTVTRMLQNKLQNLVSFLSQVTQGFEMLADLFCVLFTFHCDGPKRRSQAVIVNFFGKHFEALCYLAEK